MTNFELRSCEPNPFQQLNADLQCYEWTAGAWTIHRHGTPSLLEFLGAVVPIWKASVLVPKSWQQEIYRVTGRTRRVWWPIDSRLIYWQTVNPASIFYLLKWPKLAKKEHLVNVMFPFLWYRSSPNSSSLQYRLWLLTQGSGRLEAFWHSPTL